MRAVLCMVVFLVTPSIAWGELRDFIPKILKTEGYLDFVMNRESVTNEGSGGGLNAASTLFSERITISATGYVYHPRFIVFLAKVGGGFDQENLTSNISSSGNVSWHNVFENEYEFRAIVLPEHPYNLEVFAIRQNPFIPGRISLGATALTTTEGATLRYKKSPYFFMLGYDSSSVESNDFTTDSNTARASASYFKQWLSASAGLSHVDSTATSVVGPTKYTTDELTFNNQMRFFDQRVYFTTDVSANKFKQDGPSDSVNDKRLSIQEQLNLDLPWNFYANLSYTHYDESEDSLDIISSTSSNLENKSDSGGMSITHRLYQSLVSSYSINYTSSKSFGGDFQQLSNSLSLNYVKNIPWGRLLSTVFYVKTNLDRTGTSVAINEPHSAPVGGTFSLNSTDVDLSTVDISVTSKLTGLLVDLTEINANNIYYQLNVINNAVQVFIVALPPTVTVPDPTVQYDFKVTYSLTSGSGTIDTTSFGASVRLELFNKLVNPYYSYSHSVQKVTEGFLPGEDQTTSSNTLGISLERAPYTLLFEYQEVSSDVNPSTGMRVEATYQKDIAENLNLYARSYYTSTSYGIGPLSPDTVPFDETSYGADLRVQKAFPRKDLTLSGLASFVERTGLVKSSSLLFNSLVTWKVAKLDLSLGANVGRMTTEVNGGSTNSLYQYYYLKVNRKLF